MHVGIPPPCIHTHMDDKRTYLVERVEVKPDAAGEEDRVLSFELVGDGVVGGKCACMRTEMAG